jgi:hypothetical protein
MTGETFADIEQKVHEVAWQTAVTLLQMRLAADPRIRPPEEGYPCKCGARFRIQNQEQPRTLDTTFGQVTYRRPYGVCDRCGLSYAPLDSALGIPPRGGSISRNERICHAAVATKSFERATEVLSKHGHITISAKQVRLISEAEGRRLVNVQAKEVEAFQKSKCPIVKTAPVKLMVVCADGGRLQTIQKGEGENDTHWKEDKVGAIYDAILRPQDGTTPGKYQGAKAHIKTYVATLKPWETFGYMLSLEAFKRGYPDAQQKLYLSDGAQALRTVRQDHFPDATFILDWYHANEHLSAVGHAAFSRDSEKAKQWHREYENLLWEGKTDAIIEEISRLSIEAGKPEPKEADTSPRVVLHRNVNYFTENQEGMDYPSFRHRGWPLGSGIAESGVKQFGIRMKGTEKFWNWVGYGLGADEMLALCALYLSEDGRWNEYWKRRAQPYQRE